ncbi:CBO0543 family protein [Tumebacillus permanentifrigoris]|uniref:Quercetin dioxygenase-like cupin family protein n=1 Tax=Tumebacillus permanentifrigoris TaxID=378543 RepID=A0A316D9D5_9BACL|nr:CBO0543 family protein [Tumebacillus permanentifrigoris]PWK13801.1 quercetin dioxygenase-like cupin family protein [Tumebacillus permanentifrigoris]
MPFLLLFLISWLAFLLFADWKKWRMYAPVSLLAMVMSLLSDQFVQSIPLWTYQDTYGMLPATVVRFMDDIGVYPVTAYLFVQYVPRHRPASRFLYFLAWTSGVILLEKTFCIQGWMAHKSWWNLWCSYLCDWLIFYALYRFMLLLQRDVKHEKQTSDVVELMKQHGLYLSFLGERNHAEVMLLEVEPGSEVPAHTHSGDEFSLLLQGQLEVTVGAERQALSSGQWLNISREVVHSAVNRDAQENALVLSILLSSGLQQKLREHTVDQLLLSSEPIRL